MACSRVCTDASKVARSAGSVTISSTAMTKGTDFGEELNALEDGSTKHTTSRLDPNPLQLKLRVVLAVLGRFSTPLKFSETVLETPPQQLSASES
jgi:hypothetical protein